MRNPVTLQVEVVVVWSFSTIELVPPVADEISLVEDGPIYAKKTGIAPVWKTVVVDLAISFHVGEVSRKFVVAASKIRSRDFGDGGRRTSGPEDPAL